MFYTRPEQMKRTGYWCMSTILARSLGNYLLTPATSPHEWRRYHCLLGFARFRLRPHQNPRLRALAMVGHHYWSPDSHHLGTLLVLPPRLPDKCLVLDPGGAR